MLAEPEETELACLALASHLVVTLQAICCGSLPLPRLAQQEAVYLNRICPECAGQRWLWAGITVILALAAGYLAWT